jgi:hypothetical protein
LVCSDEIPAVPRNAKFSEFRSEPFRRREKCSEFRTVELKIEAKGGIRFRTMPQKRKQLGIPFRRTKIKVILPEFRRRNPDPARKRPPGSSVSHKKTRLPQILKIGPEKTSFVCSGKLIFPWNSRSVPSEWALPRNSSE